MRAAAILLAATLLALPSVAQSAGTIEIAPTTLDLSPGKAGLLYLANNGHAPLLIQIQPMDWTQNDGANALAPSNALIASPPLLRIAPRQRQVVRVLADGDPSGRETEYRLLVSELPNGAQTASAVNVLLQFNIPVFVARASVTPAAAWSAIAKDDKLALTLRNNGYAALKISGLTVARDNAASAPVSCGLTYILPGAQHAWTVPWNGAVSVRVATRDERSGMPIEADIPVLR
ncbi:MAG TPA: fimbria/pilus periplasmic chaperone [Rhizomicrobium sp.]